MSSGSEHMRAAVIERRGPPEPSVLKYHVDWPVPKRNAGEVLVLQEATSVNHIDCILRSGKFPTKLPKVPGGDVSGVVEDADPNSKFKKGDRVFALTPWFMGDYQEGTYARYASVKEEHLVPCPPRIPLLEAAGVPLVGLTAWQALEPAGLKPGARVLVLGASGGVGTFGVQLAKVVYDAHVVGVVGPRNVEFVVMQVGADEVVNYKDEDFTDTFHDEPLHFDLVLDPLGGENTKKAYSVLKPDGYLAHVESPKTDWDFIKQCQERGQNGKGPRVGVTLVKPDAPNLQKIANLLNDLKIRCFLDSTWALDEAAYAQRHLERGHARGKVIIFIGAP